MYLVLFTDKIQSHINHVDHVNSSVSIEAAFVTATRIIETLQADGLTLLEVQREKVTVRVYDVTREIEITRLVATENTETGAAVGYLVSLVEEAYGDVDAGYFGQTPRREPRGRHDKTVFGVWDLVKR